MTVDHRTTRRVSVTLTVAALLMYGGLGGLGAAAWLSPHLEAWLNSNADRLGGLIITTVLLTFCLWVIAAYILANDDTIPGRSRKGWIFALVIFNLMAGVLFNLWYLKRHDRDATRA